MKDSKVTKLKMILNIMNHVRPLTVLYVKYGRDFKGYTGAF